MKGNHEYKPASDFVSKAMKRIYSYEASRRSLLERIGMHGVLQRYVLALGGTLFGILNATRVF